MSLFSLIIYAILSITAGLYFYFKRQFSYFERNGIPYVEASIPLGNMNEVTRNVHFNDRFREIFDKLKNKGSIIGFYNFVSPIHVIADIEVLKHIAVKDFNTFVNRGVFVNEEEEPLTGHLFALEDDRWRFLRHKLSPVFTSGKLKHMFTTINDKSKNLIKRVERNGKNGATIETKSLANRFTVDIISSVAFGMDANTLNNEHEELMSIFREIFGGENANLLYFVFMFAFPNLSKKLHLRQFSKKISDFFMEVVSGNIKRREDTNDNRNDFLNMMIQLKNKGSIDGEISTETKKLTLNEILAQAFLFFFAGSDTSSTAISFTLAELAFNPDIQEKLREEILEHTKASNGEINYENLHDMTYLSQVVNEAIRMHSPVPFTMRKANEDYKVPGSVVVIKKNSIVWMPSDAFHHDDRYWNNPFKFDPDRFSQEEVAKRPPQCYFPFGEGPRNCIGMRLGLMNAKAGVASIIRNFKVTPDPKLQYPIRYKPNSTTFEPIGGFLLKYEKV